MRPLLVRLAVVAGALLFVDLLVGVLFVEDGAFRGRPLPPFRAINNARQRAWVERADQATSVGRFDRELGWSYRPGSVSADGRESFNSLGARGRREYAPAPPDGVTRVVSVGDSFTFGEQISDSETYQALLERRHRSLEVLNFGVGGYGTDQALLRFRRVAPGLGGEVAVLGILLENIGRNVNRYRPLWHPNSGATGAKPRFVLTGDVLTGDALAGDALELVPLPYATRAELLASVLDGSVLEQLAEREHWLHRPRLGLAAHSNLARIAAGYLAYSARTPRRLWLDAEGEPYRLTLALIQAFADEARELGFARSLVLIFPQRSDVAGLIEREDRYWAGFTDELERRGIEHIDLVGPLAARHLECEADPSQGTVWYGSHLSSVGNAVVADLVWDWLEQPR